MRFSTVTLFAALSSLAFSQSLGGLPDCSKSCYENNLGSCGLDPKCICSDATLIANLACCVSKACNQQDTDTTIKFAQGICAGVSIPSSAACPSDASSTGSSTGTAAATGSNSTAASTTASSTSASQSAQSTGAAAIHTGIGMGVAIAGLLAAL